MIFIQLKQQLQSLYSLLLSITDEQYTRKIGHLGDASIGGHTRHIIELLQCVVSGYTDNEVDYLNRSRNLALENNKHTAQSAIQQLENQIVLSDKVLKLKVEEAEVNHSQAVSTTFFREIVYNTEHAIHHLALIKVALIEMNLHLVDNNFGMAYSTIKYKETLSNA